MKIYISGPMTGIEDFNFPAFNDAARRLREEGYEVVNPAEVVPEFKGWEAAMRDNIRELVDCDGIALLPGWARSRGATLEVHIAASCGLVVFMENGKSAGSDFREVLEKIRDGETPDGWKLLVPDMRTRAREVLAKHPKEKE